jgi:heptosyltransferase-2
MKTYKNILVVQTAFLGDVIIITPLIRALNELMPKAKIDTLQIPQTVGALKNNPYINQIITFDKRKNKFSAFWSTLKKLRKNQYDLAVTPHSSTTTALLLKLAGIPERLGFDRWHAARYLTMKVPHYDDRGWHKIQKELHLLSVFTDQTFSMQTELFPDENQIKWAKNEVLKLSFPDKPAISIAPGSVWNTKKWPDTHYIELCRMLSKMQINIIFIGGADEKELCERIINESGINAKNYAGETNILQSAALIGQCRLMICNDSGALHIANAMKTDVYAFFGPTVQNIGYYPYRENDHVFEIEMDCRPCGSHGGDKCPLGHHKCMIDISPKIVFDAICKRLSL